MRGRLYIAVLAAGGALLLAAVISAAAGCPALGWRFGVLGLIPIAALLAERWRYKRLKNTPSGPGWVATEERFVDPESGKLVTVYYQPATGERRYVAG